MVRLDIFTHHSLDLPWNTVLAKLAHSFLDADHIDPLCDAPQSHREARGCVINDLG